MMYAVIHPTPECNRILLMYTPIITTYRLSYIIELNKTYDNSGKEEVESVANSSDAVPQYVGSFWEKGALQESLHSRLWRSHQNFEKLEWKYKPFIAVRDELIYLFVGMFVGPIFIVGASLNLARRVCCKEPELKGIERAPLYWKVLCFIEASFESVPQIILQTYVFFKTENVALWIYLLSVSCSALGIIKATWTFYSNKQQFMDILEAAFQNEKEGKKTQEDGKPGNIRDQSPKIIETIWTNDYRVNYYE